MSEMEINVEDHLSEGVPDLSDFPESSGAEDCGNMSAQSSLGDTFSQSDSTAGGAMEGVEEGTPQHLEGAIGLRRVHSQSESISDTSVSSTNVVVESLSGERVRSQSVSIPLDQLSMKRRSSTRSIKRRRFDDEIVESSLNLTPTKPTKGRVIPAPVSVTTDVTIPGPSSTITNMALEVRRRPPKSSRRPKKSRHSQPHSAAKDLGRWKPTDDLALITAIQQTLDLDTVHRGVKFSCHFTLSEITERWYALLYDPSLSRLAISAVRNLHPDTVASVQARTLCSKEEEKLLSTIPVNPPPTMEVFQELLRENPQVFRFLRSSKALQTHWNLMKQYHLLPNQSVQPIPKGDTLLSFSDAEDQLDDVELSEPADEMVERELMLNDRRNKREIRILDAESSRFQVMVEKIHGIAPAEVENPTLAVLRGRLVRYLMRSREITLGRGTPGNSVDADLSLEGPAWKISRRQASIKLRTTGDFYVANEGRRPIFIDGRPVLTGNQMKLIHNSMIEVAGLRFTFLVNQELIAAMRQEVTKLNLQ